MLNLSRTCGPHRYGICWAQRQGVVAVGAGACWFIPGWVRAWGVAPRRGVVAIVAWMAVNGKQRDVAVAEISKQHRLTETVKKKRNSRLIKNSEVLISTNHWHEIN